MSESKVMADQVELNMGVAQGPEQMTGESMDIAEQRREELKQLFPGVFTETTDAQGNLIETVDFERLKSELGTFTDVFEGRRERYGMDWPGKRDCMKLIQEPTRATLKPVREESVDFDSTKNLFIEGDNLEVLKLLQKSYYGKVKMIYIDPPYNTGKEFIYPDNYQESLETYLAYAGLVDDEGKKFSTNTASEGRFHTKWLNMMYPRMYLARNLLKDNGVVFISIDDNELENLRRICDEIFGEENFISSFVWEKRKTRENRKSFSVNHDHILCYAKTKSLFEETRNLLPLTEEARARYKNPDGDPRGDWQSVAITAQAGHGTKSQFYTIETPSGRKVDLPSGNCWRFTEQKLKALIADNRIWFGEAGGNVPRQKVFLNEIENGLTPHTLWAADEVGTTDEAKRELNSLFDNVTVFDTPKPVGLLERMIHISNCENEIVMDFFSGSCPIAEAAFRKSASIGRAIQYIAVQLPEKIPSDSEVFYHGYKTIADVGKERIRRFLNVEAGCQESLEFSQGDRELCQGFKVFRLDSSNFLQWDGESVEDIEDIVEQLEMHVWHVDGDSTQEEVLYEILLKAGFELTEDVDETELAGKSVFSIAGGALLICLEDELTSELIDAVVDKEPMQFICLDKGFKGNDQLKANAVQTFKARSQNSESELVFKVV